MSREQMSFRLKAEATETAEAMEKTLLSEIEEELRQAMSVQPSPDFARKVRARIDERRVERDWWTWRWAAAAACVLAVVIGWRMVNRTDEVGPAQIAHERTGTDVRLAAAATPPPRERSSAIPTRSPATRTSRQPDTPQPEVIVPGDNARAVAQLLALARNGSITEERLTPAVVVSPAPTLDVPPLGVPALPVPEMEIQNGPPFGDGRRQ